MNNKRRNFIKIAAATTAAGSTQQVSALGIFSPQTSRREARVVIIGSGFGGAVSALRLAQAGVKLVMLERGQWWRPAADGNRKIFSSNFPPDHRSSWFKTLASPPIKIDFPIYKYAGVLDYTDFKGLRTYQGAAVGGGSVVYGGVTVRSPSNVLRQIFGSTFNISEFENKYYPKAETMLGAKIMPDDIFESKYYRYAQVFTDHGLKAGYTIEKTHCTYDFDIIREEINGKRRKSAIIGETIYGNNSGCKKTLLQSYLQPALDTGNLEIMALTQVERISQNNVGSYTIYTKTINARGQTLAHQIIDCEYLFLAAGTVGTNTLLLKAKAMNDLPALNEHVGSKVGSNGDITWARTVREKTGVNQGAPLNRTLEDLTNPYGPLRVECAYFPVGVDTHSIVQVAVHFDAKRPGPGRFTYSLKNRAMELDWPSDANSKGILAHQHTVDELNRVNGGFGGVPIIIPKPSADRSAHPLGGVPLGLATDNYGRVKAYNKLYVMDGSLIPGSCLANPSLTITALAERNIENILYQDFKIMPPRS